MAKATAGRIVTPRGAKGKLDQAAKIYKKHLADKDKSELKNLVDFDWDVTGPTIATALDYHERAEALKGQMEDMYRKRDALIKPIVAIDKASAAYLKGKYRANPKQLAVYGYQIDDTPRPGKAAKKDTQE